MEPKLLFSPQVAGIKMNRPRTPMGSMFSICPGTPTSSSRSFLAGQTPSRDNLIKVTFQAFHDNAPAGSAMYVTGSLPSLGCWDAKRARKMVKGDDRSWILAVYIPERAEFLYQYLLLQDPIDSTKDPVVLWEGALERKFKLDYAVATPNKQLLLSDDTRGEISSPVPIALSRGKSEAMTSATKGFSNQERREMQDEIEALVQERTRCQNELSKLKDIISSAFNSADPADYKKRESYIPDSGALYETIRQIQSIIRPRAKKGKDAAIAEDATAGDNSEVLDALRKQVEDQSRARREAEDTMAELLARQQQLEQQLEDQQQQASDETLRREEALARAADQLARALRGLDDLRGFCSAVEREASGVGRALASEAAGLAAAVESHVAGVTGGLRGELSRAQDSLRKEVGERRRLHNLVQELRGNIRVYCRVRPISAREGAAGGRAAITFPGENEAVLDMGAGKAQAFQYDSVFGPASTQEEVFEQTQPLVVSMLDGYNVCIFAYGQTGSGKTHTMQGYAESRGVNTRALEELFRVAAERRELGYTYEIQVTDQGGQVSLMEIYNETIRDLIEPREEGAGEDKRLDVKLAPDGGTHVPGLALVPVSGMEEVAALLRGGERNRSVGRTNMNEHSSRSHMILSVHARSANELTGARAAGKLHLVDLAGSERVGKSGAEGDRLKEAQNINKSLSALGDCVQSLVAKAKHIPFRNSKLTFLLQDSLGGDSKALMFVCVSPSDTDSSETLCSLNFAARVRNVELGPAKRRTEAVAGAPASAASAPAGGGGAAAAGKEVKKAQEEAERRVKQLEAEAQQQAAAVAAASAAKSEMEKKLAAMAKQLQETQAQQARAERLRKDHDFACPSPTKKPTPSKPRAPAAAFAESAVGKENASPPATPRPHTSIAATAGCGGSPGRCDTSVCPEGGEGEEDNNLSVSLRFSPSKRRESALQPRVTNGELLDTPGQPPKKPRNAGGRQSLAPGDLPTAPSSASRIPRPPSCAAAAAAAAAPPRLARSMSANTQSPLAAAAAAAAVAAAVVPAGTSSASKRQSLGGWR